MERWLIGLIVGVVALVVALIFEDSRDAIFDFLDYVIHFEWFGDAIDFFGGIFENLGEFSFGGLLFGIGNVGLIFFLRKWMLDPFINNMSGIAGMITLVGTYVVLFVVGYLIGKRLFDD